MPGIAGATLEASKQGLKTAARDPALIQSFWLLTQFPLCARRPDFLAELTKIGVNITAAPTLFELVGSFSDAIDAHIDQVGGRTDLGEMAQLGAAETLTTVLGDRVESLFGSTPDDVRRELARMGTPANFSSLARDFFARLSERYLKYFLSRELSNQLAGVKEGQQFREALALHCRQASKIVEKYASDWFSKANLEGGITPKKAARFVSHAVTKLSAELQKGAEGDGD